jgi:lambda family phage minor tail protein L
MTIQEDIQRRSTSPEVELFEIREFDPLSPNEVFRFCSLTTVNWQGQQYSGLPCEGTGFELTTQSFPRPKLAIGNFELPGTGINFSAVAAQFNDFIGAQIIRRTTLEKYLDGLPTADAYQELDVSYWRVEQKINDDEEVLQWELSFLGLEQTELPRRSIFTNHCSWEYRDDRCGYTGAPVAKLDNTPTTDPLLDRCGRNRAACALRFGNGVRRFGGFPGARFT